eukprot:3490931-Heterocapsa_arctica.AAC.1
MEVKKVKSHIRNHTGGSGGLTGSGATRRDLRVPEVPQRSPRDPPGLVCAQGPQKRSPRGLPDV